MSKKKSKELPVGRKYELMIRDHLVKTYVEKHKRWRKNCFDETLTQEVEQLQKQIKDKWNARLHWPESTIQGLTDFWMLICDPYRAVEDARVGGAMILQLQEDGFSTTFSSFKDNGLIHCPPDKIPIIIDPTILTLYGGKTVKEEVWKIVTAAIVKRRNAIKGRDFAIPAKEPEALAAVFRCKAETFEKNLRRYDQWERGLYVRLITYVEMKVTDPKEREKLFKKYAKADKKPPTITSSMPDDLARAIERKENAVRKGIDIIYFAIHRKERTSKPSYTKLTNNIRKLNCPNHLKIDGKSQCPLDCPYLIDFLQDFEKDMPSELPQVSQRECLDILGDSGNLIKKSGKYTIVYRNNDIKESEE